MTYLKEAFLVFIYVTVGEQAWKRAGDLVRRRLAPIRLPRDLHRVALWSHHAGIIIDPFSLGQQANGRSRKVRYTAREIKMRRCPTDIRDVINLHIVCQIEGLRKALQAFGVRFDRSDEEARCFGGIAGTPFLASFFVADTSYM